MAASHRTSRRSLLGAALAVTGLAGTGLASRLGRRAVDQDDAADDGADEAGADRIALPTMYLDRYTVHSGASGGAQRSRGDQTLLRGTLVDAQGLRVGEVFASAVTMPGGVEPDGPFTSRMETQHLHLDDGGIVATGVAFARADLPNVYTVVGGSGRFAGARGSYTFEHDPTVARPEGRSVINFDLEAGTSIRRRS